VANTVAKNDDSGKEEEKEEKEEQEEEENKTASPPMEAKKPAPRREVTLDTKAKRGQNRLLGGLLTGKGHSVNGAEASWY